MITVLIGNLFASKAQTLVNTVNCVGVMGKGIALEFKKRFPDMYEEYVALCQAGQVKLGRPYLYRQLFPPWILNFPTKDHWRAVSRLSDIIAGLEFLEQHYKEWGITSLAVPPLGCGQGQLEWRIVGPTLYRHLSRLDVPVELYAPAGTPEGELNEGFLAALLSDTPVAEPQVQRINPAWVALVAIVDQIVSEPYHWPVGRTIFQKIAYFATESGLPTGLQYKRSSYGPFAQDLKAIITRLVNNGLLVEEELGRMFAIKPGTAYADAAHLYRAELEQWQPLIERVTDLFLRMKTDQAEVAATVHFSAHELAEARHEKPAELDVFEEVKRWKQKRRKPLKDTEIGTAIRHLNVLRWLDVQPSTNLPLAAGAGYDP